MAPSRATSASLGSSRGPVPRPARCRGRPGRQVFQRMHGQVDLAAEQRLAQRADEDAGAADLGQLRPADVAQRGHPDRSRPRGPVRSVIMSATWRDCAMAIGLLRLPSLSVASASCGTGPWPRGTRRYHAEGKSRRPTPQSDAALTAMKKDPDLAFLSEVSSVPLQQALRHQHKAFSAFFGKRARYPRFKSRRSASPRTTPASAFTMRGGELRLAKTSAPLRFVWSWPDVDVASAEPDDGDRVPRAGRPLVRDLRRRHATTPSRFARRRRARRRRRPRREGLRGDRRTESRSPTRGTWSARPGTWPATSGAWPAASKARRTGPRPRRRSPAPTARSATPGGTSCTAPAPAWSATTT